MDDAWLRVERKSRSGQIQTVSTMQEIKQAIERLPKEEFRELSEWIINQHDENEWDRQFEEDIRGGRLDKLAQEAVEDLKAGRTRPFPRRTSSRTS